MSNTMTTSGLIDELKAVAEKRDKAHDRYRVLNHRVQVLTAKLGGTELPTPLADDKVHTRDVVIPPRYWDEDENEIIYAMLIKKDFLPPDVRNYLNEVYPPGHYSNGEPEPLRRVRTITSQLARVCEAKNGGNTRNSDIRSYRKRVKAAGHRDRDFLNDPAY